MGDNGLTAWLDATLQPEDLSPRAVASEEALRLSSLVTMASMTTNIPRRLGDATSEELRADKKLGRQIAHRASRVLTYWVVTFKPEATHQAVDNKAAAQVVWSQWWEEHQGLLLKRKQWVATWGIKHNHQREANQFLHLLEMEEQQLKDILS